MEEEWRDIKLLERKLELNKQMYLEFGRLLSLDEETVNAIENLINKNKELQKENEHLHREINRRIKLKIENEKIVDTQLKVLHELLDESEENKCGTN